MCYLSYSAQWTRLLKTLPSALAGLPLEGSSPAVNEEWLDLCQLVLEGHVVPAHIATIALDSDQSDRRTLRVQFRPSKIAFGSIGVAIICEDVSAKIKMENELETLRTRQVEAAKMAALGEMSAGVAHEVNNPLAILSGNLQMLHMMLEDSGNRTPNLVRTMATMERTIGRISKIVGGLRAFSRQKQNDPLEMCDLNSIVIETLSFCEQRFKNDGMPLLFVPSESLIVLCRPTQISEVVLNLLNNSFDAIEDLDEKWVEIKLERFGKQCAVRVTDSGRGIDPSVAHKMMQPFFTTKEVGKGTGLGLSISQGIMQSQGGSLSYDTSRGRTSFLMTFPLFSEQRPDPKTSEARS